MRKAAIIRGYNAQTRRVKVEILGLTDGSEELPEAELEYPLGDDTTETEIRLMPLVWVDFINDDMRYPIVTGNRCKNAGNDTEWRRFKHENIQLEAFNDLVLTVGNNLEITVQGATSINSTDDVTIESGATVLVKAGGSTVSITDSSVTVESTTVDINATTTTVNGALIIQGFTTINGGMTSTGINGGGGVNTFAQDIEVMGVSFIDHQHLEQGDGNPTSQPII